jgi:hypothetical protein
VVATGSGSRNYPKGKKITDAELAQVKLKPHAFHCDWKYEIKPHSQTDKR